MNEQQLIEGCKAQKREFQKALYEQYAHRMFAICLRYSSSKEAAEDLLQDGFIKVFASIGTYQGKGSFEGWLKKIFLNQALEAIRKGKSNAFADSTDIQQIGDIEEEDTTPPISEEELLKMIQDLPAGYRTVFNLYAIEDLSHREIAGMLGINEVTSRSQYNRARQILQTKVQNYLKTL